MKKILILLIAFVARTQPITLHCTFNYVFWTAAGSQYSCIQSILRNLDVPELTAVNGTHHTGKSNNDVIGLAIHNYPNLSFFPKNIENFFPNLSVTDFWNTNISSLNGDELNPFPNFLQFALGGNPGLERIPGNLFSNTRNLRGVWLNSNRIKHVGEGFLDGLNLTHANFLNNYCVSQFAFNNNANLVALIETLRTNCTDLEDFTTTTLSSTTTTTFWTQPTTTTPEPTCGNFNDVVCNLQEQNQLLIQKNEQLIADNEELKENVESLKSDVENLKAKNQVIDEKLDLVLEGLLELSTRPCGV